MGKHQRRKDNLQTASSSKAAHLMQASGVGIPFIGLESSGLGLLNFDEGMAAENVNLAPEFRIVLKKLTKRDALTREKAVIEFAELSKKASSDQLKLSFEYFAPIYQRLVTDVNSGIRSGSNKLLAVCISTLKKEASNHCLKQTLPFLLLSTADHSNQVVKSANSLLTECFSSEKRNLLFNNFADDALSLSLSIVNRKHRLVFPQQFTDEESNEQRRSRLVVQALNCIDKLFGHSSDLASLVSALSDTFTHSESLNPLMALGNNCPFFDLRKKSRRQAFECFLRLAQEDAFFEQCSLDKTVVPKLLSLIRKKEGHWELLASSLLPAFSIIFVRIGLSDRKKQFKFGLSVLDSFFDGSVQSISLSSWNNAFVEICKYCFVKISNEDGIEEDASEFVGGYFQLLNKFVDFTVNGRFSLADYGNLAEFIGWIQYKLAAKMDDSTIHAFCRKSCSELEDQILSLLPKSNELLVKLMDVVPEKQKLTRKLLTAPNSLALSNALLIKSADAFLPSETNPLEFDRLLDVIASRIRIDADSFGFDTEIIRLIGILCQILMKIQKGHRLTELIQLDNIWTCFHTIGFILSDFGQLLDHNSIFSAIRSIFHNVKCLEPEFDRVERTLELILAYICENCSDSEREQLIQIVSAEAELIGQVPKTLNFVFYFLIKREKQLFAERFFKILLEKLHNFSAAEACKTIAYFKNVDVSMTFSPFRSDVLKMTRKFDSLFSAEILSREELFTAFSLLHYNAPIQFNANSAQNSFDCLVEFAKFALFYCQFVQNPSETDGTIGTEFCYVFIELDFLAKRLPIPSADAIADFFLAASTNDLPFCAFYSILKFAVENVSSQGIPNDLSPNQKIFEIAIQMRPKANFDLDSVEHRNGIEDWLFTTRSSLGCVLLKFCGQIVPFLAEIGGPIRDFVNCALITAFQNCTENLFDEKEDASEMHWLMGHFALVLAYRYENGVRMNQANNDYSDIGREWAEFFGPSVANSVLHWFLQLFFMNKRTKMPPQFFVKSLCNAIHSVEIDRLIKAELPPEFVQRALDQFYSDDSSINQTFGGYSNEKRSKLALTSVLFFNSKPEIQFAAAAILKGFLFEMFSSENAVSDTMDEKSANESEVKDFEESTDRETDIGRMMDDSRRELQLPRFFKEVLCFEFAEYSSANKSEIDPPLLCWDVLMRFLANLDVLSRVRFCEAINTKTLSSSLAHLFNSLSDPLKAEEFSVVSRIDDFFAGQFHFQQLDRPFDREHFVCNLFFRTLTVIPALFREWHGTLGKMESKTVNQYSQKYVSHLIIRRELRSLENMKRGKLEIRVLPKVREVECVYRLEEAAMNLSILLPENYPIGAPKVETGRCIVSKELHRKWLLQLGVFLNGQNGAMLDGILQWKRSIDQHLKGVEECTICMSTVSSTNYQLPRIRCRQCRKKFHGDCLLHEQNAPVRNVEPDRDLLRERRFHQNRSLKSDPTSPVGGIDKEFESPLDFRRVLSGSRGGSERKKLLVSSSHPSSHLQQFPYTAPPTLNTLGVDIAVEALRRRQQISVHQRRRSSVLRTVSSGEQPLPPAIPSLSPRQRFLSTSCSIDQNANAFAIPETLNRLLPWLLPTRSSSLTGGHQSGQGGVQQQTAQQNNAAGGGMGTAQPVKQQHPFPAPKSKFKMAHESFRARMLQEMQDSSNEAVFMTKKRTADSKFSEFKGGDLNKYTAQSYAIRNGVEIFGG
uniref:E3 ubiquitin-protein ligase listerin n=1 Tax=Globodera pallida TaxID=36090 RepID=A0A183C8U1_GLOPA